MPNMIVKPPPNKKVWLIRGAIFIAGLIVSFFKPWIGAGIIILGFLLTENFRKYFNPTTLLMVL